jgi:hypothetical protein
MAHVLWFRVGRPEALLKRSRCSGEKPASFEHSVWQPEKKEPSMMRSVFGRMFRIGRADQVGRDHKAKSRRLEARVEGLERRNLMTTGSVVLTPGLVTVSPSSTGPNTAIVSYQNVKGTTMLDVNLNGSDHYFSIGQVGFVYYMGSGSSGAQTPIRSTSHRALPAVTRSSDAERKTAGQSHEYRDRASWMLTARATTPQFLFFDVPGRAEPDQSCMPRTAIFLCPTA